MWWPTVALLIWVFLAIHSLGVAIAKVSRILERLDRFLTNPQWQLLYPNGGSFSRVCYVLGSLPYLVGDLFINLCSAWT